jgi:glycosyltransferase involved in cell wall biosynthesis
MNGKKQVLFVKYGSFSHVNGKVEAMLRQQFPDYVVEVVDVALDVLASYPAQSLWLRLKTSMKRLVPLIRGRHSPWDFIFQEPKAWALISSWIMRNVDPARIAFIFQTQSMFDASHPDIPFFIYTDHTHKAHKRQPLGGTPAPVSAEWRVLEGSLYSKASAVFTLSRFCALSITEDYGIAAEVVMPVSTGINMELPLVDNATDPRHPVVLFVASEWGVKGGEELAASFKLVRRELPSAELWVVGAKPPVIQDGIKVLGTVKLGELDVLFRKARLVCVPSRVERASMVALDAAAYGLPVIMTPHGAGSERVRNGETGFLVDPRDTDAVAGAILALLRDPAKSARMGSAGRKMVEEEFTWDAVGEKIAGRIRSIIFES